MMTASLGLLNRATLHATFHTGHKLACLDLSAPTLEEIGMWNQLIGSSQPLPRLTFTIQTDDHLTLDFTRM